MGCGCKNKKKTEEEVKVQEQEVKVEETNVQEDSSVEESK
jgi:hypothetical protein